MAQKYNILVIGSGGREHAFGWKLSQSQLLNNLYFAPGNPGTALLGQNFDIEVDDFDSLGKLVIDQKIDLVIVGPEVPLVKGIKNYFDSKSELKNCLLIGPDQTAALLEGSKDFAKAFMQRHNVPTAAYQTFNADNLDKGYLFLDSLTAPYVLKADGLAAGKGVIITKDLQEAKDTLKSMISDLKFGDASSKVVIEEFLDGIELSVFVLTDGNDYVLLPDAKDYKRIGVGDTGLNTGGMGAVSPVPFADHDFMIKVENLIVKPTIEGIKKDKLDFIGFVFIGLINVKGEPMVIEYNCRMGDPETEVVMLRLEEDLIELFLQAGHKQIVNRKLQFSTKTATTIVKVAGGYPENYEKGDEIIDIEPINENVIVFHSGTKLVNGKLLTNGGRVLAISALGNNIKDALQLSNLQANKIKWKNNYHRNDIGLDLI